MNALLDKIAPKLLPKDDILIVGTGPLARYTGEDLVRRRRVRIVGYLRKANDPRHAPLNAPVLGDARDLQQVLERVAADEVYIAGDITKESDEMRQAVKACEHVGMPFALPVHNFRFDRAL